MRRRALVLIGAVMLTLVGTGAAPTPPRRLEVRTGVLVVGGSPAGVAAAVAAARARQDVILLESRPFLGTVLTGAMLNMLDVDRSPGGPPIDDGVFGELLAALGTTFDPRDARSVLWRMVQSEDITVAVRTRVVGLLKRGARLAGVVVRDAAGQDAVITARVVIDATDDADIAAGAGAPYSLGREESGLDRRMQPASLLFRLEGVDWIRVRRYIAREEKPDGYGGIREDHAWGYARLVRRFRTSDPAIRAFDLNLGRMRDGTVWVNALHVYGVDGTSRTSRRAGLVRARRAVPALVAFLRARAPGFERARLAEVAPELYVRETRHVEGLYRLQASDVLRGRRFWDGVAVGSYPLDLRPYDPDGATGPFAGHRRIYAIPLRSLIPLDVTHVLIASRAFSASYQAAASARIVATTMAMGEAAGITAATCAELGIGPSELVRERALVAVVQRRLAHLRRGRR